MKRENYKAFRYAFTFAFLFFTFGLTLNFAQPTGMGNLSIKMPGANQNYRIGPGDVIDVSVSQSATLSRTGVRVGNDGTIQLPMLDNTISAGCKTERELAEQVKESYKKYVLEPSVTVAVQQFNSTPVALIGAVNSPGRFQLQRPVRVLELLTFVNGPGNNAGETIEIIRISNLPYCDGAELMKADENEDQLISLKLSETLKGEAQANPFVRAGDILTVTQAEVGKVFIGGNVKNPMAMNVKDAVSLRQAIAMAGGLSPGAKAERIKIQRLVSGSLNRTDIIVNFKEIELQKRDDVALQANDIIEVPGPKPNIFRDIVKSIIPTITNLPLRVIP